MKKLIFTLIFSFAFFGKVNSADYSSAPPGMCTFDQILINDTANCFIHSNYFFYAIQDDFKLYENKNGKMSTEEFESFYKRARHKQKSLPGYKKKEREEARVQADYECSLQSGSAKNTFAAKKIYKTCMKKEGF